MNTSLNKRFLLGAGTFAVLCFFSAAQTFTDGKAPVVDVSGHVISVSEYRGTSLDSLVLRSLVTYKGRYPETEEQYDTGGALRTKTVYTYRTPGHLSQIVGSDESGTEIWKYTYTYDEQGRFIEEISYGADNAKEWRKTVAYGVHGYPIKEVTLDADDTVTMQETLAYNDSWLVSEWKTVYPDGRLLKRMLYTYNEQGKVIAESHYDIKGLYERIQNTYTRDGRLKTVTAVDADGSVKSYTVNVYGANGKVAEEDVHNPDSTLRGKTEYTYDSHLNWIRKIDSDGQYTVRELKYGD